MQAAKYPQTEALIDLQNQLNKYADDANAKMTFQKKAAAPGSPPAKPAKVLSPAEIAEDKKIRKERKYAREILKDKVYNYIKNQYSELGMPNVDTDTCRYLAALVAAKFKYE